jgi:hypothetical protein
MPAGRTCCNCDAAIGDGQQWCLQCGAGQPGSLGERPNWRPLTTLALAAVLLVGAAGAAGAAALSSHKAAKPHPVTAVALVPATTVPAIPGTSTPGATTPVTPGGAAQTPTVPAVKAGSGGTGANPFFPTTGKAPKIPSTTPTPKSSGSGDEGSTGSGSESNGGSENGASEKSSGSGGEGSTGSGSESNGGSEKAQAPSAILLDTDAAGTYNPYNYPEAGFGDPALAIDGEALTAWTGQVQPSSAPNMAEGVVIDLKSPTKLGAVTLSTLSRGMSVQLYGANGYKAPATITEPGWTQLSSTHVLKKRTTHVKLHSAKAFRFLVVWIVKAPASAIGTPAAPGHVNLNEVELFPPAS